MTRDWEEHWCNLALECDCGCAFLNLNVDKIDGDAYWAFYELNFYTLQKPFWSNFKENMKLIWSIVRGKRYCMYGIILKKAQWEEFKKFVNSVDISEKKEDVWKEEEVKE